MAQMTREEMQRRHELSAAFDKTFRRRREQVTAEMNAEQKKFLNDMSEVGNGRPYTSRYTLKFYEGLRTGVYKKPSEFFGQEMGWLFQGYILPRFREDLLVALDVCTSWQYGQSYYRRSFRSADYLIYFENMMRMVRSFHERLCFDSDIADILEGKLSDEEKAYQDNRSWCVPGYTQEAIAAELNRGNEQLRRVLTDSIMGEGGALLTHDVIGGIVKSTDKEMHELLGKLLLASRLQEGLRQAICEKADEGTPEAFRTLLKVIAENDLIRFSAVKRAVGTWTGLLTPDSGDLERISGKTVSLIVRCMEDSVERERCLASEDSMEIYIALWSMAFGEVKDACKRVVEYAHKGSHHQLLTAGYFIENLEKPRFAHKVAKHVVKAHAEEQDILAVYLPHLMSELYHKMRPVMAENGEGKKGRRSYCKLEEFFDNREEAEGYYALLKEIRVGIKGKEQTFSPCIFPWYAAKLRRDATVLRLAYIASALQDNGKIDEVCEMFGDADAGNRDDVLQLLLAYPETDVQRRTLTAALCDKSEYTKKYAYTYIRTATLSEENYLQMEDMLRYKAADARANLITLLYERDDEALYGSVSRLLSDKKEEKRTAALDMVMQLSKDEKRSALYARCLPLAMGIEAPTTKEKVLLDAIAGTSAEEETQVEALYSEEDSYAPVLPDNAYTEECVAIYMRYFPESQLGAVVYPKKYSSPLALLKNVAKSLTGGEGETCKQAKEDLLSLSRLVEEHSKDEFTGYDGTVKTMNCSAWEFLIKKDDGTKEVPFRELWEQWYRERNMTPERLLRANVLLAAYEKNNDYTEAAGKYVVKLYGKDYDRFLELPYGMQVLRIVEHLDKAMLPEATRLAEKKAMAVAVNLWFMKAVPDSDVVLKYTYLTGRNSTNIHLLGHAQITLLTGALNNPDKEHSADCLALKYMVAERCDKCNRLDDTQRYYARRGIFTPFYELVSRVRESGVAFPGVNDFLRAAYWGDISERTLYWFLFREEYMGDGLRTLSNVTKTVREQGRQVANRGGYSAWSARMSDRDAKALVGRDVTSDVPFTEEDKKLLTYVCGLYEKMLNVVLAVELHRGDSETEFSKNIREIQRIYGMDNFVAILSAMGKDTLERCSYSATISKKGALSHLLSVCVPEEGDNAEALRQAVAGTDISEKRLIEAAMYAPEWIGIVGEYLGWEGFFSACYYFMAHMNESFDDRRKAIIAKYTPLTDEELNQGAFDIDWFRSAYESMGKKRFDMIYDAAKYISDGAKHSRARKYADAALGKTGVDEAEKVIADKRNKDLLMAYALIPLGDEDDMCRRYLFLQKFLKESKQFGSQRAASEKKAVEIGMRNLAMNAGYADVTRLSLRMETKLIDDSRALFEDKTVGEVVVRLQVNDDGTTEIVCVKGGKPLKSVPAALKKNEYIVKLTETKKALTEQYRRTRVMFEQAMEDGIAFTVGELDALRDNPVVLPILRYLVFIHNQRIGFLSANVLTDYAGNETTLADNAEVVVAHPYHIYRDGHWTEYQRYLFERKLIQPFKQVFRELYVKTAEEAEMKHSLRYSGNQIQPAKTVACLKSRRWVADVEDGLQKVYYRENIVARIYAMADWFSPADIEAPTLEWVEFSDRRTGKELTIKDIPDILFSEVMRDVDLAVSVAHAGGVDPETSHSTVEMRAALLSFTLPLFRLTNVEIQGSHAHIEGKLGNYTVHLGSGVIHKQGGAMIHVLPVHSQHRGKLFLPFADDDPKTAEILTKVLFLAEDSKIKDPTIAAQLR